MTDLRQAAQWALQYLESNADADSDWEIITALRTALEQPEQEPVAYFDFQELKFSWAKHMKIGPVPVSIKVDPMKLYSEAPQRQWVGLTDEDMKDPKTHILDFIYGARWAEAKLKERNI